MEQHIINNLQQYQEQINTVSQEITKHENELMIKRTTLEQLRGAFTATYQLAQVSGLVDENGNVISQEQPEVEDMSAEDIEVVEAEEVV